MISSTCFEYSFVKASKSCFKVPVRRNCDCTSPNKAYVNLKVSTCDESLPLIQWNFNVSRSASLIRTWEKACLIMSPHKATGSRRFRTSTLQRKWNFIEVAQSLSNHSSKGHLGLPFLLHQRQYVWLYSVTLLLWLLCVGDNVLAPLESHRSLYPQYLLSVGSAQSSGRAKNSFYVRELDLVHFYLLSYPRHYFFNSLVLSLVCCSVC